MRIGNTLLVIQSLMIRFQYVNIKTKFLYRYIDQTIDNFREISELETEIIKKWKQIHGFVIDFNIVRYKNTGLMMHNLSGSLNEGSFSARLFFPDTEFPDGIHRGHEIDTEMTEIVFPKSKIHCVQDLDGKPGFVEIFVRQSCQCCIVHSQKSNYDKKIMLSDISSNHGYIQHRKLKDLFLKKFSYSEHDDYLPHIKGAVALLLDKSLDEVSITNRIEKITKATNAVELNVNIQKKLQVKLSLDMSYNIKLLWKPTVMAQWEKQNRSWPPLNDLQEELQYGYIIAKPSFAEKDNPNTTELRYSFAHLERKIVSLQSSTQRLVYLIFKSMFYRWIIPIDPDRITSYVAKTIMLWTCEKYPPGDPFWADNTQQILLALRTLFQRLLEACQNNFLPYYFVSGINVLESIPIYVSMEMSKTLTRILPQIPESIPKESETVKEILQNGKLFYHKSWEKLDDFFSDHGMNWLTSWRPDVFPFYGYRDIQKFHRTAKEVYKHVKL